MYSLNGIGGATSLLSVVFQVSSEEIVQGSLPISQRCNALGIENQFYSYKFYTNMMKFLEFTDKISPF